MKPRAWCLAFASIGAATSTAAAAPAVEGLTFLPNPNQGAYATSGVLAFATTEPATSFAIVHGPARSWVLTPGARLAAEPGTEHMLAILGLKASTAYRFQVAALGEDGVAGPFAELVHENPSLPLDFPAVQVLRSRPTRMEPGLTFFRGGSLAFSPIGGVLLAVDAWGDIVWYARGDETLLNPDDARQISNGDFLTLGGAAREFDAFGNLVGFWDQLAYGTLSFHHDVTELASGNFLTLGAEAREVSGYPGGETFTVVGDVIVEFTRAGALAGRWSLFDVLDPHRVPWAEAFHGPHWEALYGPGAKDWTHSNAVLVDPRDGAFIVSVRNQDAIVKITREDPPALVWVLGRDDPDTAGDDDWPFLVQLGEGDLPIHQHAPELGSDGRLLVYDNGDAAFGRPYTRVVEYAIDEEAQTFEQTWEWIDPDYAPPLYAPFVGDADRLPGGTVLVCDGGASKDGAVGGLGDVYLRIAEVDRATGEKVFEIALGRDGEDASFFGYRAGRIASLYPPEPHCAGVPVTTGWRGVAVELWNVARGRSQADAGRLTACLRSLAFPPSPVPTRADGAPPR